jgi:TatD DNase family protein
MLYVPEARLLCETDCPYLAPVPFRGQAGRPEYAAVTCQFAANLRGVDFAKLKASLAQNAAALFGL